MILKDKIAIEPGFQYVIDNIELMSAAGRRRMLQQEFLTDPDALNKELNRVARILNCLNEAETNLQFNKAIIHLRHQHMQMHDLQGTLNNLRQHVRLEELELCARIWFETFPDDKAPDGRHVERLFVYGNHDASGQRPMIRQNFGIPV